MKKVTWTQYKGMMEAIQEQGFVSDIESYRVRLKWKTTPDEELRTLTLEWDQELNDYVVTGHINQVVH
jgi:hypothetical protein